MTDDDGTYECKFPRVPKPKPAPKPKGGKA